MARAAHLLLFHGQDHTDAKQTTSAEKSVTSPPKSSLRMFLKNEAPLLLFILALFISVFVYSPTMAYPSMNVTIDLSSPLITSQFSSGMSLVDTTLNYPWGENDLRAVNNVKSFIKKAIHYVNTPTMAWGLPDPWPDPSQPEPGNWASLDSRIQLIIQTGSTPVITLNEAPWWMKGQLQPDGTTRTIAQSEEWSDTAFAARVLDNRMDAWLHLVQRTAERYMAAPYNVRYFQVWNELKGYYNPVTNAYDYTLSPGNPYQSTASHGYTYMYNQVYQRLMQVALSLGIPTSSIQIGGPYPVLDTWSSTKQSNPSRLTRQYGTYDQRSLDVIQYWLQHKIGAGFITLDGSNDNKDHIHLANPFTASEKFADVTLWIRSLSRALYPGAATLPIWWAEWYVWPYMNPSDDNLNNAIKSYAMIELIKAGGAVPFLWGGTGEGTLSTGLWTTTSAGGGRPLPWYYSYKALGEYFGAGTKIYKTTVSASSSIAALASSNKIMLVNKTARTLAIHISIRSVLLYPYQVKVINI